MVIHLHQEGARVGSKCQTVRALDCHRLHHTQCLKDSGVFKGSLKEMQLKQACLSHFQPASHRDYTGTISKHIKLTVIEERRS